MPASGHGQNLGPIEIAHFDELRFGGQAFYQQSSASAGGRILAAWEGGFAGGRVGLRLGGGLDFGRLERVVATDPAPIGLQPLAQVAGGPVFPAGARLVVAPWLSWTVGYGHPVEAALPSGYRGPVHYLVQGPDFEVTLRLGSRNRPRKGRGVRVEPVIAARFLFRESRPLGAELDDDKKPHLTVGGGLDLGLRVGG